MAREGSLLLELGWAAWSLGQVAAAEGDFDAARELVREAHRLAPMFGPTAAAFPLVALARIEL